MILPNPSVQLEPGHKVVVFVHHLKEGLSAEQLAEYRRMDDEAVAEWSRHPLHREAKSKGQDEWYASYRTVICTVNRHFLAPEKG